MIGVVGLGNVLLGDEGVGIEIIRQLREYYVLSPHVDLIDGGVGGFSLPFHKFKKVIIVDAVRDSSRKPGDIVLLSKEEILSGGLVQKLSMHDVSLDEIFFLLALRDELPDEIILIGIVPLNVGNIKMELSSVVMRKIPHAIGKICKVLNRWGITVERRDRKSAWVYP